jgi:hypothetical protein
LNQWKRTFVIGAVEADIWLSRYEAHDRVAAGMWPMVQEIKAETRRSEAVGPLL